MSATETLLLSQLCKKGFIIYVGSGHMGTTNTDHETKYNSDNKSQFYVMFTGGLLLK